MSARTVTHNKAIHIVEKSMTVDQLIMIMYNSPAQIVYDHFKMVNSHLKNNMVQVGQIVLLSPANSKECTVEEAEFLDIAESVDRTLLKLDSSERQVLAKRYDFLSNVASYNGLLLGVSNTAWNAHTSQEKSISNVLTMH
jgi:predicted Zn-ribbon and HTH transcriptional regulator